MVSVFDIKPNNLIIPDDTLYIDIEAYHKLLTLWNKDVPPVPRDSPPGAVLSVPVPTDIHFAKTIPLPHLMVNFDGQGFLFNTCEDGVLIVNKNFSVAEYIVGVGAEMRWAWSKSDIVPNRLSGESTALKEIAGILLALYYSVQILLLNPKTKTLLSHPQKEKTYIREGTGKERKRVVKYVRKHYITTNDIDDALGISDKNFERKTMAWYVIGHWRQYKNGTRKFIQGYWKGPLRGMKRSLDDGRVRLLET